MSDVKSDSFETVELLEQIGRGDQRALESLLARHRDPLHAFVEFHLDPRLRARFDPSDVVQETQLEAVQRMDDFLKRRPMPFHLWIRKAAYERLLRLRRDHQKSAKRSVLREIAWPERSSLLLARQVLDARPSPSSMMQAKELAQRVSQAVAELAEADREILLLREADELPYEEIGCLLEIEPAAARKRYGRALIRLQKILSDQGLVEQPTMNDASVRQDESLESLVAQVVDEFREAQQAGAQPDIEAYLARYPHAADLLRKVLASWRLIGLSAAGGATDLAGEPVSGLLGDFRIVREIGRGGMGVVYEAEQISLTRRVALKVLPFAATMDPRQLQRFHNEARAAAGLHHTNIVPVYGVGQERGIHYYAMQFIEGQTLAALIAQQRQGGLEQQPTEAEAKPAAASASTALPVAQATSGAPRDTAYFRRAAEWGIQAAEALDCAHALGVVHRDVKPANLLIDDGGRLWITDFGLAQVLSDARLTLTGDLVGTLRYMSPEQALAKRVVIDHRTDVYSLGATLYEQLTLQPVFEGNDRQELLRQIAFEEPKPLRRVNKAIPAELETIVLKALEKNPADRYATGQEFADDLRRWLEDQPIRARRPGLIQRARKWTRRHQGVTVAVAAALLVVALVSTASAVMVFEQYQETREQEKKTSNALGERTEALNAETRALAEKNQAFTRERDALYRARIILANHEQWARDYDGVQELLDACPPDLRQWEWHYLARVCRRSRQPPQATLKHKAGVRRVAFSPDGKWLVGGISDGSVKAWDFPTGRELFTLRGNTQVVESLAFSRDGQQLAAGSRDGTIRIWDTKTQQELHTLGGHKGIVPSMAFSPDGQKLASCGNVDGTAKVWDLRAGADKRTLTINTLRVRVVAFSPDGKRIATGSSNKLVKVWDAASGQELLKMQGHTGGVNAVAFSLDGKRLASASGETNRAGTIKVWDAITGEALHSLAHVGAVIEMAILPDGQHVVGVTGIPRIVKIWNLKSGREVRSSTINNDKGNVPVVSAEGRWLASCKGVVTIWETTATPEGLSLDAHAALFDLAFSPDGRQVAAAGADGAARLFDAETGQLAQTFDDTGWEGTRKGSVFGVAFSPDGRLLASASANYTVKLWDTRNGRKLLTLRGHTKNVNRVAFSPDGKLLASASQDKTVKLWDTATGQLIYSLVGHRDAVYGLAFSPDGRRLASACGEDKNRGQVIVWDAKEGREASFKLSSQPGPIQNVAYSADGRRIFAPVAILAPKLRSVVKVWDATNGTELPGLDIDGFVSFSPEGKRLVARAADNTLQLCDPGTGEVLLTLRGHTNTIMAIAFSRDGRRLASGDSTGIVRVWDATPQ